MRSNNTNAFSQVLALGVTGFAQSATVLLGDYDFTAASQQTAWGASTTLKPMFENETESRSEIKLDPLSFLGSSSMLTLDPGLLSTKILTTIVRDSR